MTENTKVSVQQSKAVDEAKSPAAVIRPPVDIFEDKTGITVQADMPGVPRDRLAVNIDADTLTIEGEMVIPMPEDEQPLYVDVAAGRYERSFSLSRELDSEKISANLTDGVLTLRIPKREEHKPRRIEVRTA